jgi:cell fate (sporulation/competence/biofilm development) regulator YlbF (YheA/YmcA/DUF963 family)
MTRFKDRREIYDQVMCLSEKDKQAPMEVIKDFFDDYRLSELRDIQDQIQKVCLTSDEGAFTKAEARSNLLSYNDKLIRLLEAASFLQDSFVPIAKEVKTEVLPKITVPSKNFDTRVSDLVRGINDVSVDVAHLCVIIVKAWTANVCAEMKIPVPPAKKTIPPPPLSLVDIDKLHSMALTLQNKLAKLAGVAVDILISELNVHYINPQKP